jgi:hypothetical protein
MYVTHDELEYVTRDETDYSNSSGLPGTIHFLSNYPEQRIKSLGTLPKNYIILY